MRDCYISIFDAAELIGFSIKFIRILAKAKEIDHIRKDTGEFVSWKSVQMLARNHSPGWSVLPDCALDTDLPDPYLLFYSKKFNNCTKRTFDFFDRIVLGNCIEVVKQMPAGIVQSAGTSPPYWGSGSIPAI